MNTRRIGWRFATAAIFGIVLCAGSVCAGPIRIVLPVHNDDCPYQIDKRGDPIWKPTDQRLRRIIARHFGWLNRDRFHRVKSNTPNAFLDHLTPPYPKWQREAMDHPERAILCNADLRGVTLSWATLRDADLHGSDLSDDARLAHADLRNADLSYADLSDADLSNANLTGTGLSGAQLYDVTVTNTKLAYTDLTSAAYAPAFESGTPNPEVTGIDGLSELHIPQNNDHGARQLQISTMPTTLMGNARSSIA